MRGIAVARGATSGQSARVFDVEIRLHAVTEDVSPDELRAYYKGNESPILDAILERSPSLRLGNTEVTLPENRGGRGPVGRVEDLLSLRGTNTSRPELPLLDESMSRDLIDAFEARPLIRRSMSSQSRNSRSSWPHIWDRDSP